jgi:hypothetical protein
MKGTRPCRRARRFASACRAASGFPVGDPASVVQLIQRRVAVACAPARPAAPRKRLRQSERKRRLNTAQTFAVIALALPSAAV